MNVTTAQARNITAAVPSRIGYFPRARTIAVVGLADNGTAATLPILVPYTAQRFDAAAVHAAAHATRADDVLITFISCGADGLHDPIIALDARSLGDGNACWSTYHVHIATGLTDADYIRHRDSDAAVPMVDFRDVAATLCDDPRTVRMVRDQVHHAAIYDMRSAAPIDHVVPFGVDGTVFALNAALGSPDVLAVDLDEDAIARDYTVLAARLAILATMPVDDAHRILRAALDAPAPGKAARFLLALASTLGASDARAVLTVFAAAVYRTIGADRTITDAMIAAARQWSADPHDPARFLRLAANGQWDEITAAVPA